MRTTPREVCSRIKSNFSLSLIQKDVLIGTLLGDGGICLKGRFARLHIKHSISQIPLVEYKKKVFENITVMSVRVFKQKVGKLDYKFAEFVTLTHPEFLNFYNLFYSKARKVVPNDIKLLLRNPLSLAVWFMDDGSAEYAGASLQTHSFTKFEVDLLRETIESNFGIKTTKRLNKSKWIIYFPKASLSRLKRVIGKFVLPEFRYKLVPYSARTNPVETARRIPIYSEYDTVRSS